MTANLFRFGVMMGSNLLSSELSALTHHHVRSDREAMRTVIMILRRVFMACSLFVSAVVVGEDSPRPGWTYDRQLLAPFWEGDVMHGEPILFVKQPDSEAATGELLFPVTKILS